MGGDNDGGSDNDVGGDNNATVYDLRLYQLPKILIIIPLLSHHC